MELCSLYVSLDVYITGGLGDGNRPTYRDIWRFDMRLREWKKLEILLPKEVYFHATAISPVTQPPAPAGQQ